MKDTSISCRCGHGFEMHKKKGYCDVWKTGISKATLMGDFADSCIRYVPDNLKHIEILAEKKGLI